MKQKLEGKKYAFGKAGKVAVLMDDANWSSTVGDTMRYYYESAFPILPQPEPLFDLQHQTYDKLVADPMRMQLRTFVLAVNLMDEDSKITAMAIEDLGSAELANGFNNVDYQLKVGKNKWAENQLVLYVIGKNESGLIDGIKASLPNFTKRLYDFDKNQYEVSLFLGGHDLEIEKKLSSYYNLDMQIPERYQIGIDKKPFLWIQDITPKYTNGLIFYTQPYVDKEQFSEERMIALRDSLTKANIEGPTKDSYMEINRMDLPTFYYPREIDGNYTTELRGIWEMTNEFMGGAFATFLIHDPKRNNAVFVDAFVYGPGQKKREAMKQLIYLIEELKIK